MTQPTGDLIQRVPRTAIRPSPLQPRTEFSDEYLDKLALNMRNNGVISALVVRPCAPTADYPTARFELIDGECRWRASAERLHPEDRQVALPAMEELPVTVRSLSDHVALELMLSTAVQRQDLTPLEEADALERLLAQQDPETGAPIYTVSTLAEKIGMARAAVHDRLALRKLTPVGREALRRGVISFATARRICRCPESVIPLVEDEVLHPQKYDQWRSSAEPLTVDETIEVIEERYVRALRNAPWDLEDEKLFAVVANSAGERQMGGACADCPWNSRNQEPVRAEASASKRGGRQAGDGALCLQPECFKQKQERHVSLSLCKAKEDGAEVLSDKEAAKAIGANGWLVPGTKYIKLDDKVDALDLSKAAAAGKKPPTWEDLTKGETKVPVVVAVDACGHVHRLAERRLAVAAAEANGKGSLLVTGRGRSVQADEVEAAEKRDADKRKELAAIGREILGDLVAKIEDWGVDNVIWSKLIRVATDHAGTAGCNYVVKRRGLNASASPALDLEELAQSLSGSAQWALVLELLLSQHFSLIGSVGNQEAYPSAAAEVLGHFDVDVDAVAERVRAELAEKKRPKKEKAAPAPPVAEETAPPVEAAPASESGERPEEVRPKGKKEAAVLKKIVGIMISKRCLAFNQIEELCERAVGRRYESICEPEDWRKVQAALREIPEVKKAKKGKKAASEPVVHTSDKPGVGKTSLVEAMTAGLDPKLVAQVNEARLACPTLTVSAVVELLGVEHAHACLLLDAVIDAQG